MKKQLLGATRAPPPASRLRAEQTGLTEAAGWEMTAERVQAEAFHFGSVALGGREKHGSGAVHKPLWWYENLSSR